MRSLYRKELRGMLAFAVLLVVIHIVWWLDLFWMRFDYPNVMGYATHWEVGGEVFWFLVVMGLANGLLIRESEEGTLTFLDGLPIGRGGIFAAKLGAALTLLGMVPLLTLLTETLLWWTTRTSIDDSFPWQPILISVLLDAAALTVYLSLALALSMLRQFSWMTLGVLVSLYVFLDDLKVPFVPLLNPFRLCEPRYLGAHRLIPSQMLGVQGALALACLLAAYFGFAMLGDGAQRFSDGVARNRLRVLGAALLTAATAVVWFSLVVYWGRHSGPDDDDRKQPAVQSWPIVTTSTARYAFVVYENQLSLAAPLLKDGDAIEKRVRSFLGAPPIERIQADLTGSVRGHAGVAHWKKVNIALLEFENEPERLPSVLGHETTHVYIGQLSDSRVEEKFESTRFFNEGLASYVEYHLFSSQRLVRLRRAAAVARARHEVKLEELVDNARLTRTRDSEIVYPLGEAFVAALVERYGPSAPGRVVRAFVRPKAPHDLNGIELWQDALQSCHYDLSVVEDGFYRLLDRTVAQEQAFIASLPRLHGALSHDADGAVHVEAHFKGKRPGTLLCRFRPTADTEPEHYDTVDSEDDHPTRFTAPEGDVRGKTLWYQLGWSVPGASQPLWEPWSEAPL